MNHEAESARLRIVFNKAVEAYPRHLAAFLSKEGELAFRAWWGQLYEAVRDTQSGLDLLAELQSLREFKNAAQK